MGKIAFLPAKGYPEKSSGKNMTPFHKHPPNYQVADILEQSNEKNPPYTGSGTALLNLSTSIMSEKKAV